MIVVLHSYMSEHEGVRYDALQHNCQGVCGGVQ